MTSFRLFKMAVIESEITSAFMFGDCTHLRRWKYICIPNFDEIFQSTAQIKLHPVLEMDVHCIVILLLVSILTHV